MKIEDRLDKYTKSKLDSMRRKKKKRNKEEKIDWADMMGMKRDRYERRGGAIRRK